MLIVDAQIHLWAADTPDRPWPPGGAARGPPALPVSKDMALAGMNEAGVDRAVIVPPSWEGERNDLALEAARPPPRPVRRDGPISDGEAGEPLARRRLEAPAGMLGMRFTFNTEQQRPWLTDGTADWLWPEAERAGIPLMMSVSGQLPSVDRLAERHPGLKLVIDHLGLRSGTKGEQAFAGLPELLKLARHAERRGQGLRAALLLGRGLSLSRRAAAHPERVRRVLVRGGCSGEQTGHGFPARGAGP